MTSSSDLALTGPRVIRRDDAAGLTPIATPDLRSGTWTRLGGSSVLGDSVTEATLDVLADQARAAAEAHGYAAGWAHGAREGLASAAAEQALANEAAAAAERRRSEEHSAALAALYGAADAFAAEARRLGELLEQQAADLAVAVVEAALGAAAAASTPADVVRRAVEVLPQDGVARLVVHPSVARSTATADLPATVSVVADASMGPADALVQLDDRVVDLRLDETLARVRRALDGVA